jgi:hypothetical protein
LWVVPCLGAPKQQVAGQSKFSPEH